MSDQLDDVVASLGPVAGILQQLGIRFYVGGSVASSFHGAMRTTMDVDIVAELQDKDVSQFINALGDAYYVSEVAIRNAVRTRSSFNLIHFATSFKVDVFANRLRPFDERAFARAAIGSLSNTMSFEVPIASPEDSIITKLEWYRLGDEVSERQWNDVTTLVKLLRPSLDVAYLETAAKEVGVADLLKRLLSS